MKYTKKKLIAATGVVALLLGLFAPQTQVFITSVMNAVIEVAPSCDARQGVNDHCLED